MDFQGIDRRASSVTGSGILQRQIKKKIRKLLLKRCHKNAYHKNINLSLHEWFFEEVGTQVVRQQIVRG